jgi:hypothetical protein
LKQRLNQRLEDLLLEHYGAQNRTHLFVFWLCFVVAAVVAAWVMIKRPDEGLFSLPVVAVGIPSVIGIVISDVILLLNRREHLVHKMRAGIAVRRVQRAAHAVPTIFVELADGRMTTLQSPDDQQLARIEKLLRVQMETAR